MNKAKMKKLQARGWKFGTAAEFLKLSPEESALIELKLRLAHDLSARRLRKHHTQHSLARLLGSSQSRVAKMEAGDPSVSLDLLFRSLLALGASSRELAKAIA